MILVRAVAAQCELCFCFEDQVFITKRSLTAQNAIVRTCPERQVVTMDSTLRCTGHFNFVEFRVLVIGSVTVWAVTTLQWAGVSCNHDAPKRYKSAAETSSCTEP